jgi:chemotaxis protein methyltransferase CheR
MEEIDLQRIFAAQLSDAEFSKLSKFIYSQYGIKMPPEKRIMLQSRLQKRLRA